MINNNWHSDTIARFKALDSNALLYIRSDAYEAAKAGETINNPKTGPNTSGKVPRHPRYKGKKSDATVMFPKSP